VRAQHAHDALKQGALMAFATKREGMSVGDAMSASVAELNRHVHNDWKNLNEVRENPSRW
jgi:hypothetical protein